MHIEGHALRKKDSHLRLFSSRREPPLLVSRLPLTTHKEIVIRNDDTSSVCWSIRKIDLPAMDYQARLDQLLDKVRKQIQGVEEGLRVEEEEDEYEEQEGVTEDANELGTGELGG